MTTEEALALIAETNEPLAAVLKHIVSRIDQLDKGQSDILEPILAHIISQGSTLDLTVITKILDKQRGN